jgi:hypothetical protein
MKGLSMSRLLVSVVASVLVASAFPRVVQQVMTVEQMRLRALQHGNAEAVRRMTAEDLFQTTDRGVVINGRQPIGTVSPESTIAEMMVQAFDQMAVVSGLLRVNQIVASCMCGATVERDG